jgi:hypothetical protein
MSCAQLGLVAVRGAGGLGAGAARNRARSLSQVRFPEPPLVIINLAHQERFDAAWYATHWARRCRD